jgi:hypothetical protein
MVHHLLGFFKRLKTESLEAHHAEILLIFLECVVDRLIYLRYHHAERFKTGRVRLRRTK